MAGVLAPTGHPVVCAALLQHGATLLQQCRLFALVRTDLAVVRRAELRSASVRHGVMRTALGVRMVCLTQAHVTPGP